MDREEKQAIIEQARDMIQTIEFCEDMDFAEKILSAIANCEYIPDEVER
jgi:hypothetical protein